MCVLGRARTRDRVSQGQDRLAIKQIIREMTHRAYTVFGLGTAALAVVIATVLFMQT